MNQEVEQKIDLWIVLVDVLRAARKLLWLLPLLCILLSAGLCGYRYLNYQPYYRAEASFTVYVTNPLYADIRTYNAAAAEQMAMTFPSILTSGVLSERVKERLDMEAIPAVSASVLENTNIFTMSVSSTNPQLAWEVLQAVIEVYPEVAEFVVGSTNMILLDESGVPSTPVNPFSFRSAVVYGVALGGLLWGALLVLLALTRKTIHNESELKQMMNLRCLGVLPLMRRSRKERAARTCPLMTTAHDHAGFSESVRLLRIRTEKQLTDGNVLLVSSAIPGEGKTTVAVNLALSLAMRGHRTLLIDCDLRNPSVSQNFGKPSSPGFSDYLQGKAFPQKIIQPTDQDKLFLITGGTPVSDASALLAKKEAQRMIELSRKIFEYVILDTPPCSMLVDAAEIAGAADGALMTIRQNFAARDQILEGIEMLSGCGVEILGCVLNGVQGGALNGAQNHYGYGYGYGYGNYGKQEKESSKT